MVGIYLSGTGNTRHCLTKFIRRLDANAKLIPLEDRRAKEAIRQEEEIVLAYPTQFSNIPYMVRDFIQENKELWAGKRVFCFTTMGAFSGDGTGCAARRLRRYGAIITGGLQVRMPDAVSDNKMLKKSLEENRMIIARADEKIEQVTRQMLEKQQYPTEGLSLAAHLAGLFGQRLWFYHKTTGYSKKLKISEACVGCGLCIKNCPMGNLSMEHGVVTTKGQCTMCYRCISSCPKQAITLLGHRVYEQCRYDRYVPN